MTTLIGLEVAGRAVLVAGGSPVAARRARALTTDGALVTVVAPELCEELVELVDSGAVRWRGRAVAECDLHGVWLAHAATDDPATNAELCRWATDQRIWSVDASAASSGSARTPATTTHAGLCVGVVSQGAPDPARAVSVRNALALALACDPLDLRARRHRDAGNGRVVLVGGGPGAEDLVTVRGRRVLSEADAVVTDRLAPTGLLADLPADVQVIHVGKAPGRHSVPQDEINRILVEQAERGRTVVRLKGGDPFVFGRGGEEALACRAAGIPVEVVPGVSSALAAPAVADIPLTHRGTVGAVHVVHGHRPLDASAVACVVEREATLVLLMGVSLLADHVATLLAAGADPTTPAAVVERATLPEQRLTHAPLGLLAQRCREVGVEAPAVVVVGQVAAPGLIEPLR